MKYSIGVNYGFRVALILALALTSSSAWGASSEVEGLYSGGTTAYYDGNYAGAFELFSSAADQGHASSQNYLGIMYMLGRGVIRDDSQAAVWFRKAADQGHASAQFNLGDMYAEGRGVDWDDIQAVEWFRKAADQGYVRAHAGLGFMYAEGRGVARDQARAIEYWRTAARQGNEFARYHLTRLGIRDWNGQPESEPTRRGRQRRREPSERYSAPPEADNEPSQRGRQRERRERSPARQ